MLHPTSQSSQRLFYLYFFAFQRKVYFLGFYTLQDVSFLKWKTLATNEETAQVTEITDKKATTPPTTPNEETLSDINEIKAETASSPVRKSVIEGATFSVLL